jgi:tellurite resistance protein TehA-like permease
MEHSSNNPRSIGYSRMIMTAIGIFLLVWNGYYVWRDAKTNSISRGTLINAVALGCVGTTLLWVQ